MKNAIISDHYDNLKDSQKNKLFEKTFEEFFIIFASNTNSNATTHHLNKYITYLNIKQCWYGTILQEYLMKGYIYPGRIFADISVMNVMNAHTRLICPSCLSEQWIEGSNNKFKSESRGD